MDAHNLAHFLLVSSYSLIDGTTFLVFIGKALQRNLDMDEAITEFDVAMDLVTLLFLGSERRIFSDCDGSLEKVIDCHFPSLPNSFTEFFGTDDRAPKIKSKIGQVLAAATELEMITWIGDNLDQFEIKFDEKNAALRAAAINTPVQALKDTGATLCHSLTAETV
jgi:hypothetical protein